MKKILMIFLIFFINIQLLANEKLIVMEENSNNLAIIYKGLVRTTIINKYTIDNNHIVFYKDSGYFINKNRFLVKIDLNNEDNKQLSSKIVKEMDNIFNLIISPDGKFLALSSKNQIKILDIAKNYETIHIFDFKDSTLNLQWSNITKDIYVSEALTNTVWTINTVDWFKEREIYQIQNPKKIFIIDQN
jgi:WD40 repeat protein